MAAWRLACIALIDFAVKACGKEIDLNQSVVVVDQAGRKIVALNQIAARHGIAIGDSLNVGWTRCPTLTIVDWSTQLIELETQNILGCLGALSPTCQVVPGQLGYFMLDAGGMSLLGGEAGLSQRILETCSSLGYLDVRIGLASQWGVAFLAARKTEAEQPIRSILDAEHTDFINQVSLQDIAGDAAAAQGLKLLGIERLEQFNTLPRSELRERFGDALDPVFALVDLLDFRTPHVTHDPQEPKVEWSLEQPIEVAGHLLLGLRHLCISLCTQLMRIAYQTSALSLVLRLDDGTELTETIALSEPVSTAEALFELVRARVESQRITDLSSPMINVEIKACDLSPLEGVQVHFRTGRWQVSKAQAVINRLRAYANQPVVYRALSAASSLHDESDHWAPVLNLTEANVRSVGTSETPRLVRRRLPSPVEVQVKFEREQVVSAVRINAHWHEAVVMSRERRSGGWWLSEPYAFEDFRIQISSYGVCWIRHLTAERRWMLMGGWD
jgi:hypothetical protein